MVIIKCPGCKKTKGEDGFGFHKARLYVYCKTCRDYFKDYSKRREYVERRKLRRRAKWKSTPEMRAKQALYYEKNRERLRPVRMANHLRRKYLVSLSDYNRMLAEQNNKCGICKVEFPKSYKVWNRPCVDHNHQTKMVRGILCRKCNLALTYVENFEFWDAAQTYLRAKEARDKEPLR